MPFTDLEDHELERRGIDPEQYRFLRDTCLQKIFIDKKLQKKYKKLFNK